MSSTSEFREEPRSWWELVSDAINRHATTLYAVGAVLFGAQLVGGVSTLIHIEVAPVGWIARQEAANGVSYADEVIMPGLYLHLSLSALAFGMCVRWMINEVGGR